MSIIIAQLLSLNRPSWLRNMCIEISCRNFPSSQQRWWQYVHAVFYRRVTEDGALNVEVVWKGWILLYILHSSIHWFHLILTHMPARGVHGAFQIKWVTTIPSMVTKIL